MVGTTFATAPVRNLLGCDEVFAEVEAAVLSVLYGNRGEELGLICSWTHERTTLRCVSVSRNSDVYSLTARFRLKVFPDHYEDYVQKGYSWTPQ